MRVPGIDVSVYQRNIDWQQVAAAGYRYVAIRATLGEKAEGVDVNFVQNWEGAKRAGLLVTAYHVVKPKYRGLPQIERFFSTLNKRKPDLPLALDVELTDDIKDKAVIAQVIRECIGVTTSESGRKPIIYTAKYFWQDNVLDSPEWADNDLWVANYGVTSPFLPRPWTTWRFWQYTDQGTVPGVPSKYCDLNWFNGTMDDLLNYANPPAEVPKPTTLRARLTYEFLNIRAGAGVNYEQVGQLKQGDVVDILNFTGKSMWMRVKAPNLPVESWCAFALENEPFVTPVAGEPKKVRVDYLLNVRNRPSVDGGVIAQLRAGTVVEVEAFEGRDVWLEIEPGKWVAFASRGFVYMEMVK